MSRFFTSQLRHLEAYTPGEQPRDMQYTKLNTNESPFPAPQTVIDAAEREAGKLNLYCDPACTALCAAAAKLYDVEPCNIMPVNGSDEALYFAFLAFCDDTHPMAYPDISYSFYPVLCDLLHVPSKILPLEADFSIDLTKYYGLKDCTIVIANPNAPTSLARSAAQLEEVIRRNPDSIVIIDEAYVDFAPAGTSCVPLVEKYPNLIVTQTFSKSRNLAGARLGFAIADPALIADMNRVKFSYSPYNINSLSEAAGAAAMEDTAYFTKTISKICETRQHTAARLRDMGFTVLDSATNFLFATTDRMPCAEIFRRLRERGILIRYFSAPRIDNWLRITIGTPEQMQALLAAIGEILE